MKILETIKEMENMELLMSEDNEISTNIKLLIRNLKETAACARWVASSLLPEGSESADHISTGPGSICPGDPGFSQVIERIGG